VHFSAFIESGSEKRKILPIAGIDNKKIHPNHWMTFTATRDCSYLPCGAIFIYDFQFGHKGTIFI
ncbi:MAG: hypothetical protein IIV45_19365, partial [Lachnospiraceae bacterium]|nr:hypothetical protein [Lachnospiraceae bacterium]